MSIQEAIEIINGKECGMLDRMKAKKVLDSLGPVQGPQETQMERESRELRASMAKAKPMTQAEVDKIWRGTADFLPRDYN